MTFAELVGVLVGYINGLLIPFVFALAFIAFLWGIFLYLFYTQKIEQARNMILGGVVTLAIMISIWGILSVLRNSFIGGGIEGGKYYDPFGSVWDEWFGGAMKGSGGGSDINPNDLFTGEEPPVVFDEPGTDTFGSDEQTFTDTPGTFDLPDMNTELPEETDFWGGN